MLLFWLLFFLTGLQLLQLWTDVYNGWTTDVVSKNAKIVHVSVFQVSSGNVRSAPRFSVCDCIRLIKLWLFRHRLRRRP